MYSSYRLTIIPQAGVDMHSITVGSLFNVIIVNMIMHREAGPWTYWIVILVSAQLSSYNYTMESVRMLGNEVLCKGGC